jgi:CBS domain-containing protein
MAATVREMLDSKKDRKIHSVTPKTSVFEALELMAQKDISAVLVLEGENLVGIFTERDYARKLILHGRSSRESLIGELMTANLQTISPAQTVEDVMALMTEYHFRHLPVVERGKLLGIITIGDAVRTVIEQQQQTIRELSGYISGDLAPGI